MSGQWKPIDLSSKLFTNVAEVALRKSAAAIENAFINESGGQSRFPGLVEFADLGGNSPVYLYDWDTDLIAVTNSRIIRLDKGGNQNDVTGVPVSGYGRPVFDKTADELLIAAGGPIIRLSGEKTEQLSPDAPNSTHVAYIDGYVIAIQIDTGLFEHSEVDQSGTWSGLDTFAANGKPDNLTGLLITPYRELILCGPDSVEQFERLPQGSTPFFRRWAVGEGIIAPYTILAEDSGVWAVNNKYEFVKINGQTARPNSGDIGQSLEGVDNWKDAWTASMNLVGQKFILLQMPHATNRHGSIGMTLLYDYRQKKWYELYGWDGDLGAPDRWPGWSYHPLWGRHFVGSNGKILEITTDSYQNDGVTQRMLGRTAHIDQWGDSTVNNVRLRVKRGSSAQNDTAPVIGLRVKRDNRSWSPWKRKSLGTAGQTDMMIEFGPQGSAKTWQWEWQVTDDVPVELTAMWVQVQSNEQS